MYTEPSIIFFSTLHRNPYTSPDCIVSSHQACHTIHCQVQSGIFFFLIALVSSVSCTFCSSVLFVSYRTAWCGFFHYEKSDGFGRERTRDLGYQRPARKPLDHRSRYSIPGPSSPQSVAIPTELPGPRNV
jgi:hypothetical protein